MCEADLPIIIRNVMLVQILAVILVPRHAFLAQEQLLKVWKWIHAPLRRQKARNKRSKFFEEIDFTKFEP